MINDNTILSSFDDKPTLLEWLKKVEDALKTDTAKTISVENPEPNTYVFKITFADGNSISSGNVVFPNAVQDVSIKNGHIIVTQISGTQTDLGAINPYAETIVENAETNTTKIVNNAEVGGNLEVKGLTALGGNTGVNGTLSTTGKITSNGGVEVHGDAIFFDGLGTPATLSGAHVVAGTTELLPVTPNPTGEATETLEKVKIGDVAYNVGGGSDYTAGNNIEISASKAIAVKSDLTGIDSVRLKSQYGDVTISAHDQSRFKIKSHTSYNSLPSIYLEPRDPFSLKQMTLSFIKNEKAYQNISFDLSGTENDGYAFLTIGSKVPFVPSGDGTYILKAHVSSGTITYSWELQQ